MLIGSIWPMQYKALLQVCRQAATLITINVMIIRINNLVFIFFAYKNAHNTHTHTYTMHMHTDARIKKKRHTHTPRLYK